MTTGGNLGCNAFAYCNNNPTNCSDKTGCFTDGQIHDFVIEHIVSRAAKAGRVLKYKRYDTLIIYNKLWRGRAWGFCDLLDPATDEMWEVKKLGTSYSCSEIYATDQLNNYITNGYLARYPSLKRTLPKSRIAMGKFSKYDSMGNEYIISYWDAGSGILRYSYRIKLSQKTKVALAAMAAGAVLGGLSRINSRDLGHVMQR